MVERQSNCNKWIKPGAFAFLRKKVMHVKNFPRKFRRLREFFSEKRIILIM